MSRTHTQIPRYRRSRCLVFQGSATTRIGKAQFTDRGHLANPGCGSIRMLCLFQPTSEFFLSVRPPPSSGVLYIAQQAEFGLNLAVVRPSSMSIPPTYKMHSGSGIGKHQRPVELGTIEFMRPVFSFAIQARSALPIRVVGG